MRGLAIEREKKMITHLGYSQNSAIQLNRIEFQFVF